MTSGHRVLIRWRCFSYALAVACTIPATAAEDPPAKTPIATLTPWQKAELTALDIQIELFDTLLAKVPDVQQRTAVKALLDGFQDRRVALRRGFNQDAYLELRWEIDVEYQRLVAWLAAPTVTVVAAKSSSAVARTSATGDGVISFKPGEAEALLSIFDRQIRQLEEENSRISDARARETERMRLVTIKRLRADLEHGLTETRWSALVQALGISTGHIPPESSVLLHSP